MRTWRNLVTAPVPRHAAQPAPTGPLRLLAEQRSPLWTDAPASEFSLVEGKVHNLRLARQSFDGIVVPAGELMSFWRQLGRPARWRGYVDGREVQEGCVVPTTAGGLCQLSNALVRCAQAAGVEIVERHGHTAHIATGTRAGSSAEGVALDATVFWNHVDLRLRPAFDLRIEVEMDAHALVVRFLHATPGGAVRPARTPRPLPALVRSGAEPRPVARGCFSCNETTCFRHRPQGPAAGPDTAVLLGRAAPEFDAALAPLLAVGATHWLPWRRRASAVALPWALRWASLQRALVLRWSAGVRQARVMRADRLWAQALARALRPSHRRLLVSQALLPALAEAGALAGRSVHVLVDALPMSEIQRRLDAAAALQAAAELSDHRVPAAEADREWRLLRRADRLLVVHRDVVRVLQAQGLSPELHDWPLPPTAHPRPARQRGEAARTIVFPASALARKGAPELVEALHGLRGAMDAPLRLLVLGSPPSDAALLRGLDVRYESYAGNWLQQADVVALPAVIEHAPRALLAALAHGLPVVATPACGLAPHPLLLEVPAGDVPALRQALQQALAGPDPARQFAA